MSAGSWLSGAGGAVASDQAGQLDAASAGLTAGALFAFAAPTGRRMVILLRTFAGAVALHALWDGFDNTLVYACSAPSASPG